MPDENHCSLRLKQCIDKFLLSRDEPYENVNDPTMKISKQKERQLAAKEAQNSRGIECRRSDLANAVYDALSYKMKSEEEGNDMQDGSAIMVELHPDGEPVDSFLQRLRKEWSGGDGEGDTTSSRKEFLVFLGDDKGLENEDSSLIQEMASKVRGRYHKVALGSSMLLASHCIVVMNFLLDSMLHACPQRLWDGPGQGGLSRESRGNLSQASSLRRGGSKLKRGERNIKRQEQPRRDVLIQIC
uniref:Uncharacterized protein n=2 Tax=Guillardia theta TaxID=55529 RepID=A0A7S4P041_GUITH|mmetsp:Transcript_40026/g.125769  ORF Transcript_40026/g.125769 Transcript_40026/m.125769 type:complete len:243 (+) Transcript_40026:649-1377(+)